MELRDYMDAKVINDGGQPGGFQLLRYARHCRELGV